ncbi:MAG: hypothetical protein MUO50_17895, partial [Longimicrobiales bacterium]|nr:hypothetical protein [Longimicrobiales bacterium]
ETARQLAELARRTGDQQLAETSRRLQEAAETMRRSAAGSGRNQGLADATSALDDLEEAQRRLERTQESRMQEGIQDALERVDRLAASQERVREEVEQLPDDPAARRQEVQQIHEQKDEMVRQTQELERDLFRMQQSAQQESREAAVELNEAVEAIREGKLEEKLAYTKGVVEQREREFALEWEDQISSDIQALREEVEDAVQAFEGGMPNRDLEEALREAQELARGAESLGRRLENRGAPGETGQGQSGQQGQQGGRGGERTGEAAGQRVQGSPLGGATRGNPEPFTDEEIRQYTREFAQRLAQAQGLREALVDAGRDVPDLEEAIEALEALQDPDVYGDLPQIALLQAQIRENMKRVEFLLRREVEGESAGRAALTGTDEVPAGFRRMVEEYFKNLARGGGGGAGGGGV